MMYAKVQPCHAQFFVVSVVVKELDLSFDSLHLEGISVTMPAFLSLTDF